MTAFCGIIMPFRLFSMHIWYPSVFCVSVEWCLIIDKVFPHTCVRVSPGKPLLTCDKNWSSERMWLAQDPEECKWWHWNGPWGRTGSAACVYTTGSVSHRRFLMIETSMNVIITLLLFRACICSYLQLQHYLGPCWANFKSAIIFQLTSFYRE